jgi:superfamily II DNA or RNA helicase
MIEVGRNSIIVRNIDLKSQAYKNVNYQYSLYDKVYRKYTMSAFTLIDNDLYFPSSIGLDQIQPHFPNKNIIYNYKTTSKSSQIIYNMKYGPRDDLQKDSINFLMKMKNDNYMRERLLSLRTGKGKTYVTINVISKYKKKPFIIVDTLELAYQWEREFLKHTDLKKEDIIILSGSEIVEKEKKKSSGKVYIAIHRTLTNILDEDYNSVNLLMNKLKIGIRVFDEAHVNFKNVCMINSLSNVEYTIFLTATPSRSNYTDDHLYGKVMRRIPYFNGKGIYGERYHTVVLFKMDSKPSLDEQLASKTKYGFSAGKWASNLENESYEIFLRVVLNIFEKFKLEERKKKIAIMLPTISLIKKLKNDLDKNINLSTGLFIGEIKKSEREEALKQNIILTNDKMFDKGIDVQDLEILINFIPFGSLVKTEQIMGRLRYGENKSSILIDVTDIGYTSAINQMKTRKRFYKKNAKKIIEIDNYE